MRTVKLTSAYANDLLIKETPEFCSGSEKTLEHCETKCKFNQSSKTNINMEITITE